MKTSPVRIREQDKERVRRLSRDLALAHGRPASQQATISRALEFALDRRDEFLRGSNWKPLSAAEIKSWEDRIRKTKGWEPVPVEEIDAVVYGS